jgi:hypothetical protein
MKKQMEPIRVARVTFPTASFSLGAQHIDWVQRRAAAVGLSKSAYVRSLIDQDMTACATAMTAADPGEKDEAAA